MTIKPVLVPDHDAASLRKLMDHFATASTGPTKQQLNESRAAVTAAQGITEARNTYTVVFVDPSDAPKQIGTFDNAAEAKQLIRNSYREMYDTGDHLRNVAPGIYVLEEDYRNTGEQATADNYKHMYHWIIQKTESRSAVAAAPGVAEDTYKDTSGTFKDRLVGEILNFYSMHGRIPRISEYSRAVRSKLNALDFDERSKLHRQANVRALKLAGKQGNLSKLGLDEGEDDLYEQGAAESDSGAVDMKGKKCTACKKGTYQETSQHDDMDGVLHCDKCNREVKRHQAAASKKKRVSEGIMDVVKQTFNDCVAGYPQGTSEGQFLQGWARAIRAETGRDIPAEKLTRLYHDYTQRSPEIMQSHGTMDESGMSRAAKGYEKYGKAGMQALARAGREGRALDPVRDRYDRYDEAVAEGSAGAELKAIDGDYYEDSTDFFSRFEQDHFDREEESEDGMEIRGYIDDVCVMVFKFSTPDMMGGWGIYDDSALMAEAAVEDGAGAMPVNKYIARELDTLLKLAQDQVDDITNRSRSGYGNKKSSGLEDAIFEISGLSNGFHSSMEEGVAELQELNNGLPRIGKWIIGSLKNVGNRIDLLQLIRDETSNNQGVTETHDEEGETCPECDGAGCPECYGDEDRDRAHDHAQGMERESAGMAEGAGGSSPTKVMKKYLPRSMWDPILSHTGKSKHSNADGSKTSHVWRLRNLVRSFQGREFDAWKQAVEQELGDGYKVTSEWPTPSVRYIQMNQAHTQTDVTETAAVKYGVFAKGGSVGSQRFRDDPLKTFDTREEAVADARRRRSGLSKGERGYYRMGYVVKPIKGDVDEGMIDSIKNTVRAANYDRLARRSNSQAVAGGGFAPPAQFKSLSAKGDQRAQKAQDIRKGSAQQVDEIDIGLVGDAVAGAAMGLGSVGLGSYIGHKIGNKIGQKFIDRSNRKEAERREKEKQDRNQQVDELDKSTLGSYVKKSSADATQRQSRVTGHNEFQKGARTMAGAVYGDKVQRFPDREDPKIAKRQAGHERAVDRLTAQEIDEKSEAVRHGNNSRSIYHVDESVDPIEQLRADIKRFAQ